MDHDLFTQTRRHNLAAIDKRYENALADHVSEAVLIGSAEYFNGRGGGTANRFLQVLYGDVLQRPIDTSGAQTWGQALTKGASPTVVATAILASQESDQIKVEELYGQILHRPADSSGLNTYTNILQQGQTEEQLLAILAGSDEYFARS